MNHILAVRIPIGNRLFFYRTGPCVVAVGGHVLAQVDGELHMGKVERVMPLSESLEGQPQLEAEIPTIFRPATEEDLVRDEENRALSRQAYELCRQCIQERNLEMKLVDVVVLFDGSKILFFFTAPNRIDFRELVKDLVRAFRTRIELRQIGARHETQMVGGIGNCGQLVCCQRFLRQFAPATIKMAKEQNLFLNPAKISGVCNRLLCCLSYEQTNYEEFLAQCPKVGKKFATALGQAKVLRANYFRRSLNVWLESGGEREIELEEWFRLVSSPARPAATGRPDVPPKVRVVEQAVLPRSEDEVARKQAPSASDALPAGQPSAKRRVQEKRAGKGDAVKAEKSRPEGAGDESRGKTKKEGKGKSRKAKRRSRYARNKAQARRQTSGKPQDQSGGKSTESS